MENLNKTFIVTFSAYDEDSGERFIHTIPCNGPNVLQAIRNNTEAYSEMDISPEDINDSLENYIELPIYIEDLLTIKQTY